MNKVVARFPKIYKPLDDPYRYKVLFGGRAAARSWSIARKLLIRGVERPLRVLCTRELQKSIKQSVHKLLSDQVGLLDLNGFYEIQQQGIYGKNGTEFMFLGVKANPDEIRSTEGIDIAWIEEGHSLSEGSFDIIDPTIRKENSEIWISYNTRFKFDFIHQHFVINKPPPGSLIIKASYADNPYFPQVLKQQMEHMKATDYEKYLHIWEGELKQLAEGAVFGKQVLSVMRDDRRLPIPIIQNCQVDVFYDVGKSDHTAFWFMQRVGNEYRFIDYYQARLEEVSHYVKVLNKLDYSYGRHYMPHDADHDRLGMKRNIKEQFQDAGIKPITIVQRIKEKATAIELGRQIFPECWFHKGRGDKRELEFVADNMRTRAQRMDIGWDALCNYRYKYNDDDDVYQKAPHKDWATHGADAFMGFAQGYNDNKFADQGPIVMNSSYNVFS